MDVRQFVTVDVFTRQQFGGNPLAVVLDAERPVERADAERSPPSSICRDDLRAAAARRRPHREVRIFTPRSEMPFAGHPNVGTAFVLGASGESHGRPVAGDRLVFEEKAGLVPIDLLKDGGTVSGARLAAPQRLAIGTSIAPELVAAACGLPRDAIALAAHAPCIASCGAAFIVAELGDRAALAAATPHTDEFARHFAKAASSNLLLYVRGDGSEADLYCRMFAPLQGIAEDPATGSAAVALAGLRASLRPEPALTLSLRILQGIEMGRPSLLDAAARKIDGQVVETTVAGRCVAVMSGTIDLAA